MKRTSREAWEGRFWIHSRQTENEIQNRRRNSLNHINKRKFSVENYDIQILGRLFNQP